MNPEAWSSGTIGSAIARLGKGAGRALARVLGFGAGAGVSPAGARILDTLLEHAPVLVVVSDSRGRIVQVNGEWERATGHSRREVLGRRLRRFLLLREAEEPWAEALHTPRPDLFPMHLECRLVGRDGGESWVAWDSFADLHPDGTLRGVISMGVDVTVRKQALRNLQLFRRGIERSGEIVVLTDVDGKILYVNPAFEEAYGIPAGEAIGEDPAILQSGAHSPEAFGASGGAPFRGDAVGEELVNRTRNGRLVRRGAGTHPVLDEAGDPMAYLAIHRDITRQKEAEDALRQSEGRFRALLERMPGGVALVTDAGRVRYANPAFLGVLGRSSLETRGREIREFLPPGEGEAFQRALRVAREGPALLPGEYHLTRKAGPPAPVAVTALPLEAGGRAMVLLIFQELSERKRLEDRLRHAQGLQALGQLVGGIAHDFNNLLTVIQANAEILLGPGEPPRGPGDSGTGELLEVLKAARRGQGLVQKLLAFGRGEGLHFTEVDAGTLILALRPTLMRLLPASISIELLVPEGLPAIWADPGSVEKILLNLATDARDAMPEGGTLSVRLSRSRFPGSHGIGDSRRAPGEFLCVMVSVQGAGAEEEPEESVVGPSSPIRPGGEPAGLAMAAVNALVESHGGMVNLQAGPGRGTTVRIDLPVAGQGAGEGPPPRRPVKGAPMRRSLVGGTETILVVEDEPALRKAARKILELAGYRVLVARDGLEGLRLYREHPAEIDLILTDLVMPRMGGRRLHQVVKKEGGATRFLFSGVQDPGTDAGERELRLTLPFLPKPWTLRELTDGVRAALDRSPSA